MSVVCHAWFWFGSPRSSVDKSQPLFRTRVIAKRSRFAVLVSALVVSAAVNGLAQEPEPRLIFTAEVPVRPSAELVRDVSAVVEERGLALWGGAASDFGVGVTLSDRRWTVRSITSMTTRSIDAHSRPTFQQIEIVRPVLAVGSMSIAAGGGVRQEWDGTRTFIGRLLARSSVGGGKLQGSAVIERAASSPIRRDAADFVTSVGWSRRAGKGISIGVEGIAQDLEGFWDPSEADGGAKLLIGPSIHAQSAGGRWSASLTAGRVVQTFSGTSSSNGSAATGRFAGRHLGIFASAIWAPSLRH
jgi:hypothetical protein